MSLKVLLAWAFAEQAHRSVDQKRKYTGEPYIVHPQSVADIVQSVTHDENMVCAALLHDVVEDTSVTLLEIESRFGQDVASLVSDLTDVSTREMGNRKVRKEVDRQHIAKASPRAKTIKLADLIHNTENIVANDKGFAKVYLAEKRLLLEVLTEGDVTLWNRAKNLLEKSERQLYREEDTYDAPTL